MTGGLWLQGKRAWMTAAVASAAFAAPAAASTFTVNDPGDSGAGTLRQAILAANGNAGADTIDFSLGSQTISPTTPLPAITEQVTIDATADPGDVVDGSSAGLSATGLTVNASNVTIQGLEIDNFTGFGILIASSNNTIGQDQIGGNAGGGISISSGTANAIGGSAGANSIFNNTGPGIAIASNSNVVSGGNTIGDFGIGNGGGGVAISGSASNNQIGGVNNGDGNLIQGNAGAGVSVTGTGTGNAIVANIIASNDGLGIDLGATGVTANDATDPDTGPNNLQNFPALTNFTTTAGNSTITGTLNSTANTAFRIDFYSTSQCDDSGNGEGDVYVGSTTVMTDGSGNAAFSPTFPAIPDHFVTATATGPGNTGAGSTSEFSLCQAGPPTGAVITNNTVQLGVNNTGDLNYACTNAETGCPGPSAGGAGPVGLRYFPSNLDSTSPGCPCEGWGMADDGSKLSGYANESSGTANVAVNSFTHDATSAVSNVTITDPGIAGYSMTVVQDYHPSAASPNLYEDTVTVTNTGLAFTDLRYRRAMDWDIEPTAFNEYSTIQGTSPQLLFDSDNGFASSDPLVPAGSILATGAFTDSGPADHGAVFDFGFGALAHNASKTFKVYYGAAPDETTALNALSTGGAQVYSLGESSCPEAGNTVAGCDALATDAGKLEGKPATFMFGFVTTTGDLSITKSDSPDPVSVNHDLTYTLTITNNGPEAAAGVHVEDVLPANTTWKSTTPSAGGSCSGTTTVKCDFPSIGNGSSKTVTIVVTPTATTADLANTATVTSVSADANPANNSATSHTVVAADQPQISIDDVTKTEGNSGTANATFTVSLDRTAPSTVTVHYATADVTATAGADYTSTSGTATITTGNTSTTIDVPIIGDTVDEPDETYHVDLTTPSGGAIADSQGLGTITDDDGPPSVSVGDTSVTEGTGGTTTMHVPVTLSQASGKTITVDYATSAGTATAGTDYTTTTGTLTFLAGDTTKNIDVPIVTDSIDENDETFTATLSNPSATVTINDGTGSETITDDDGPGISVNDVSVTEGNSGTIPATFTVSLSAVSVQTVTVHYATSDGSATQPSDYAAGSGTLTFNPGETSKQVTVNVNGDTTVEPDEAFHLDLTAPGNASLTDALGVGTIGNDDAAAPAAPTLAISDATVNPEGNSATKNAGFTVTLSSASLSSVTVSYATSDGTATAPGDYTVTTGTLTFSPGETSKTITVPVAGDTVPEPDETFNADLSAPSGATISDGHGVGTIVDDDAIGGGGSVGSGDLFCGTQHRGKCKGLKVKDEFDRPGNASWTFAAFNPSPGNSGKARAHAAAAKPIKLGTIRKKVAKGKVSFVFKLKPGAKTKKLYKRVRKAHLKGVLITRTFTPAGGGAPETVTKSVKLKR
jgi:hypothetical protein